MPKKLILELLKITKSTDCSLGVKKNYIKRIEKGSLTISEDPKSHFVVAFAAYDPNKKTVFIGYHKKSGLWLFSGGHLKKEELPLATVKREFEEEWGRKFVFKEVKKPSLLTITPINNPERQTCTEHYDIWYFLPIDSSSFFPDKERLSEEFYETGWKTFSQAKRLITTPSYIEPIEKIEALFK